MIDAAIVGGICLWLGVKIGVWYALMMLGRYDFRKRKSDMRSVRRRRRR